MSERTLPPGDYAYVMEGGTLCPCLVLKRGWLTADVLRFRPFEGTKRKRIRKGRLLPVEQTNAVLAFKNDPMAVIHMVGEEPAA